ncbi:MAG: hypothetical protein WAV32_00145 [Halobacteriota archaeon]
MKEENRCNRVKNFIISEVAASTVLGFVIIVGILFTAFGIFTAVQVPLWTKETEAVHAAKMPLEFAELDSAIDTAILRNDSSSSGCRVEMKPDSVPVVGIQASAGMLEFDNASEKFCFMACAPGEEIPHNLSAPGWNSTPCKFSDANYTKCHVVTQDYGAELALESSEGDIIYDSGGVEELSGSFQCNKFEVIGTGTTLYTSNLNIYAREITIGSGSEINANGRGSAGGIQDHDGKGDEPGRNNAENNSAGGGGAGHGGAGGAGGASWWGVGGAGGSKYERPTDDKEALAGSGGGGGSTGELMPGSSQIIAGEGGNGGGYIFLHAPIINIAGKLSVNAGNGGPGGGYDDSCGGGGGGGSGGSILLKGDYVTVSSTGTFSAKGGNGGKGGMHYNRGHNVTDTDGAGGGGGAGGLIKIFYDSSLSFSGPPPDVAGGANGTSGKNYSGFYNPSTDGENGTNGSVNNTKIPYTPYVCYYATGYLTSEAYNTTTPLVFYGNMTWNATLKEDTSIVMKVRTSLDKNMTYAMPWDDYDCPPVVNGTDISDLPSVSDGNQYIQWRAEFMTFDLSKTPVLHWVNISYEYGIPFIVNTSGSIRYRSQYTDYRNFELVYAQGATLKKQAKGELIVSEPSITIRNINTSNLKYTKLIITAINLTGDNNTLNGGFHAAITPYDSTSKLITGGLYFTNLSINITTDYPDVWRKWFNDTCSKADLEYGTDPGNYDITRSGTHFLEVVFYGSETRPVKIWLKSAGAKIKLETIMVE